MEPSLPMPPQENQPTAITPPEYAASGYQVEHTASSPEVSGEVAPKSSTSQPGAVTQIVPLQQTPQQTSHQAVATDDTPQIADDVDVIEKEWVDKAKKIVNETKGDPHQQEKKVGKLQADYMLKRYNKHIKTVE